MLESIHGAFSIPKSFKASTLKMAIKYLSDIFIFVIEYYYWFNNT